MVRQIRKEVPDLPVCCRQYIDRAMNCNHIRLRKFADQPKYIA